MACRPRLTPNGAATEARRVSGGAEGADQTLYIAPCLGLPGRGRKPRPESAHPSELCCPARRGLWPLASLPGLTPIRVVHCGSPWGEGVTALTSPSTDTDSAVVPGLGTSLRTRQGPQVASCHSQGVTDTTRKEVNQSRGWLLGDSEGQHCPPRPAGRPAYSARRPVLPPAS